MLEPTTEDEGWKCKVSPNPHPVTQLEIDVVIGADGKKNVLPGFKQIEMRGISRISFIVIITIMRDLHHYHNHRHFYNHSVDFLDLHSNP